MTVVTKVQPATASQNGPYGLDRHPALLTTVATPASHRGATLVSWQLAVERTILAMRERLDDPLTLQAMADVAILSPYHFNRVFCQVTGLPPRKFLAALRLEAAKRLLLSTRFSLTRICLEVGYQSLGTFTTHFTQLVGLPPCRLRRLAPAMERVVTAEMWMLIRGPTLVEDGRPGLAGRIGTAGATPGPIFVGLFPGPLAQGRPVACALLPEPGPFRLRHLPDGRFYPLAVALPWSSDPLAYLLPDSARLHVGASAPVVVKDGLVSAPIELTVRPAQLTDPPVLVALPMLYVESLQASVQGMVGQRPHHGRAGYPKESSNSQERPAPRGGHDGLDPSAHLVRFDSRKGALRC